MPRAATKTHPNGTDAVGTPSNDAEATLALERPYVVEFVIEGVAPFLCHRWSDDAVEAKAKAAKGSAAKKSDDIESYVWRDAGGQICVPGGYVQGAIAGKEGAAKYQQDPRSSRKSALDLWKASISPLTDLAPFMVVNGAGKRAPVKGWDYLDRRRAVVNGRSAITRVRPAFHAGWQATMQFQINMPHYIPPPLFHQVLVDAGRLCGVGDYRPTFGRFSVVRFEVVLS